MVVNTQSDTALREQIRLTEKLVKRVTSTKKDPTAGENKSSELDCSSTHKSQRQSFTWSSSMF